MNISACETESFACGTLKSKNEIALNEYGIKGMSCAILFDALLRGFLRCASSCHRPPNRRVTLESGTDIPFGVS